MDIQEQNNLKDYLEVIKRRKLQLLLTFGVLMLITLLLALGLPSVYRSTATILIEEQDIPTDLVQSTITSFADQQIQVISQRSMTSPNINRIIEDFNLYPEDRERVSQSELVDRVREDTTLELISASVVDPRSGRPTQATIAFTLSFDHTQPNIAQRVADQLVTIYLRESRDSRLSQTQQTATFFEEEVALAQQRVERLELELATFKADNGDVLPTQYQLNLTGLARTDAELLEAQRKIQLLNERRIGLDTQIAAVSPTAPVGIGGEQILPPTERLTQLESDYASKSALYGPDHPTVVRLRREIDALRLETGRGPELAEVERKIEAYTDRLQELRNRYSESHPDVVRVQRQLDSLMADREAAMAKADVEAVAGGYVAATDDVSARINVRASPGTDAPVVGFLNRGEQAMLLNTGIAGWYQVQLPDGTEGFVSQAFTKPLASGESLRTPTNPVYIQLVSQRNATEAELRGQLATYEALQQQRNDLQDRIVRSPEVERQYTALLRDLTTEREAYDNAKNKQLLTAQAEKVENVHGQSFTLIEPAVTPIAPHWPNRLAILFLGIVLSLAATVGVGAVSESMDSALRSPGAVAGITGVSPMAVIPYIYNPTDSKRGKRNVALITGGIVVAIVVGLIAVHILYRPLDVLWYAMLRGMGA